MPIYNREEVAARAAYRIGLLEAMLHPDTIEALKPPGIIEAQFRGELAFRKLELEEAGVKYEVIEDMSLGRGGA